MRDRNNQPLAQSGQSASAFARPETTRPTGPLPPMRDTAPPPPRLTVMSVLTEQDALIVRAHELLNYLENNLTTVLAERNQAGGLATNEGKIEPASVLRRLVSHNQGIEFLIQRINDIGERLEL